MNRSQILEPDVPELDLHRRSGMHLEGDDTFGRRMFRIAVGELAHERIVDTQRDPGPAAEDAVGVPIFLLVDLGEFGGIAQRFRGAFSICIDRDALPAAGNEAACVLIDKADQCSVAGHVRLVARGVPVREFPGAELDAGISCPAQPELGEQFEVGRRAATPA